MTMTVERSRIENTAAARLAALEQFFGYVSFRPHQDAIVAAALDGNDVLGVLPTGAGKSLTFQLPALMEEGLSLVVSPLVALMEDQVAQLKAGGIEAAACCTARTSKDEWEAILDRCASGDVRILYVAPERLSSARFHENIAGLPIRRLVVDEAHCVSEWGHNFRPDYRRIREFKEHLRATRGPIPVLALTATATPAVRRDILSNLQLGGATVTIGDFDRPNLQWQVAEVAPSKKAATIVELLGSLGKGSAIVYATSRRKTEDVAERLAAEGFRAEFYHAGLPGNERERRQQAFQSGELQVMVATIAFGMGVHKDDVRHVIHHSMPRSLEAYYQEAGRAGRDGDDAKCTLLYSRGDLRFLHRSIEEAYPERDDLRTVQVAAVQGRLNEVADQNELSQDTLALAISALRETGYIEGNPVDGFRAGEGGDQGARALEWLRRHKKSSLDRLYAVRDYAETEGCRSAVLVGYFGQDMDQCGHCDACTGEVVRVSKKREKERRVATETGVDAVIFDADARRLYEHLRGWRLELAQQWNVPAFHIMSDKVLKRVAADRPMNKSAFLAIPGLAEKKWEAFGESLLSAIQVE